MRALGECERDGVMAWVGGTITAWKVGFITLGFFVSRDGGVVVWRDCFACAIGLKVVLGGERALSAVKGIS